MTTMARPRPAGGTRQPVRALAPGRAGGRGGAHLPRGGGRVRAAGAPVLRRQGLDRHAAPGREGVLAGADPVPAAARRHRAQLPRGPRVPRPRGRRARRAAASSRRCRTTSTPARREERRPTASATRCRRRRCCDAIEEHRLRRGVRRRPPRRGEGPRQGAGVLASATSSASGTRRTSGPSCGTSTTAGTAGRARPRLPAVQLDRAGRLAVHRPRGASSCRRSTTRTSARCSGATACGWPSTPCGPARGRRRAGRDASSATARSATCPAPAPSSPTRPRSTRSSPRSPPPGSPSGARPAPTTSVRGRDGGPQARGVLLDDASDLTTRCGSPPPAPSTTASPRSSAAAARLQVGPRGPAGGRRARRARAAARTTPNLALLTDGLRAEREQGITIDVAYRYFATPAAAVHPRRHPGPRAVHPQHGHRRLDRRAGARPGRRAQRRRRADPPARRVAALLRVPHVVLAVNKMDLVDYDRGRLRRRSPRSSRRSRRELGVPDVTAIPISALHGDNVVDRVREHALVRRPDAAGAPGDGPGRPRPQPAPTRFPVQYVIRPQSAEHPDYRGYAGQVASGVAPGRRRGDGAAVRPHVRRSPASTCSAGRSTRPWPPQSVTLRLADDLDISRGDLIVPADDAPAATQDVEATVC